MNGLLGKTKSSNSFCPCACLLKSALKGFVDVWSVAIVPLITAVLWFFDFDDETIIMKETAFFFFISVTLLYFIKEVVLYDKKCMYLSQLGSALASMFISKNDDVAVADR